MSFATDQLWGFAVDPTTGALTPVPGTPWASTNPSVLVGDPARRSLYTVSLPDASNPDVELGRFNIDPATGALVPTPTIAAPGYPENGGAVHPVLPILYLADGLSDVVRVLRVDDPCCIVPIGTAPAAINMHGMDVHPSGRFLYATTAIDYLAGNSSHLWGYVIHPSTGQLTPLPGSPWLEGIDKTTTALKIAPDGRHLYALNRTTREITAYAIDELSGGLARLPAAPFPLPASSEYLTITDSGRFLYATHTALGSVSAFAIEANGNLVAVPGSPFATGFLPRGLVTGGGDRFLYVATLGDVWGHTIDPVTGALTLMPGQPFPGGGLPLGMTRVRMVPQPTLSVDDLAITEGQAGSVSAVFTVRLANPPNGAITVGYATSPGTAQAPSDFSPVSGTLAFPPGADTRQVSVQVNGDLLAEPDEFFSLALASPFGAALGDGEGIARIRDDDGATIRLSALDRNADLVADLQAQPGPVADLDLYLLSREPWSSHEVVVDGASGDLGDAGPLLELVSPDFSSVLASTPVGTGSARTLRLTNDLPEARLDYVRVRSAGCSVDCGPDDTYRIRVRDTTGSIPRFNESGGQFTVLVLQNRSDTGLTAHASYWGANGARLADATVTLPPRGSVALPTPPLAQGASGSITVSHDGSLGSLAGKAVVVDPASGLSFDTPLTTRPR